MDAPEAKLPRSIRGLPDHWQNYLLCMIFHLFLPLLPLGIEYWRTAEVGVSSATLVAALYAISIGGSSRSKLLFGSSIVISIVFAIAFGETLGGDEGLGGSKALSGWAIVFMFLTHAAERYNRHVAERAPFWLFTREA